ncbi:50S ribosomal protein L29 [Enhygromyxa salina]|uniref:Large ribosomal subunit protein uL29 n=1 Tax=Enhygromyxa salina TaxID=215803 RepID=A0A2S9XF44_9BACT|nr:50S ribosomal protein L29 [Enhygromyxa salina]PRP91482.1 50S ribosomal protein L29 [Enhygromyxa salina]
MKPSELRDKTDDELSELETQLRDRLVKLQVARAASRSTNTSEFPRIRRDIARIKTILHQRASGQASAPASAD